MIITRATEYAIRALLHLSKQPRGQIVLKKEICTAQDITPAFLTKILQPLIKEGIVGSQRGVGGGFYLIKPPEEITLLDVVKAEEGPLYLNHCIAQEGICDKDVFCPIHGAWKEIRSELMQTLAKYTFADLVATEARNLERLGRGRGEAATGGS